MNTAETETMTRNYTKFQSFDSEGEVFSFNGKIYRRIFKGKGPLWEEIFKVCEKNDLFRHGIVKTTLADRGMFPDLSGDLIFEHEKIPFISYPHEWPPDMLKDAALFHIDLFLSLGEHQLALKDFHPLNIFFDGTRPVFIDFTSIVRADKLTGENYLKPQKPKSLVEITWDTPSRYLYEMYNAMFLPYFLLPLYLMERRKYRETRERLFDSTLNAAAKPRYKENEVRPELGEARRRFYDINKLIKKLALVERGKTKKAFLKTLKREVEKIKPGPDKSEWTNYYAAKNEDFSFEPSAEWTPKNRTVYEVIKRLKPETVLDMGCNTGWFSVLADKLGSNVVAFDNDEACVNALYRKAKRENLSILALLIDIAKINNEKPPVMLAASKRLKCEMVMALGIIHHLAFLERLPFGRIAELFNELCGKSLILEFISIDDKLIQGPEDYYGVRENPEKFSWYTREGLAKELSRYFRTIEIKASCPESRTILICEK